MTQHQLQGRNEQEILWFQRRSALKAAAAWVAMGGLPAAMAQQRSNIVELRGDALLNGSRLQTGQTILTGDQIQTGPGSNLMFVIGNSAFQVRENSLLKVERGSSINAVSLLRLLTGAVVSVWGKGNSRAIILPTLTAGIRGTGVYAEVFASQGNRSYFCNCYGTVDMESNGEKTVSQSSYHQAFWGEVEPKDGRRLTPANAINHSDEELEFLARLVNQQTAWEIAGRKGIKDGSGKISY
ncbi:MAG: iron dicitrate transport regulator FecR [Polaromonas sp.]|uniref:iron dicitrate transport regulator FecR n=1 Tax=Polaromonas sp. TaxID=1869339 RepID=UPI0032661410